MKKVVSVSLGSSSRDHRVEISILGDSYSIERIGTDGDKNAARKRIEQLDGEVDAIGLGGIDLYIQAGKRRYVLRDALPLAQAAKKTPVVDGTGLKDTLERRVVSYLSKNGVIDFQGRTVLVVSGADRFGLAESLAQSGAHLVLGDLIFALGLPVPLRSLTTLDYAARIIGPLICRLPFEWIYPTGDKQTQATPKYGRYFEQAEVIAGDFHFIRRYMPDDLSGKVVLTNTTTAGDVELLRQRGVSQLITTTPELNGRSFGTNVMEALLVAAAGASPEELTAADYENWLDRMDFEPRITRLSTEMNDNPSSES